MKNLTLILFALLALRSATVMSQDLSLEECLTATEENMPILRQRGLINASLENKMKDFHYAFLPMVTLNGQATYQSDVPEISLPNLPGLDLPKAQYRAYIEVYQPIYDAGVNRAKKNIESSETELDLARLELSALEVKRKVAQVYFQILMLEEREAIVGKTIELLLEQEETVKNATALGVLTENDILRIASERLQQEGVLDELKSALSSGSEVLAILTGLDISGRKLSAEENHSDVATGDYLDHPQIKLIRSQQQLVASSEGLLNAKRRPRVSAFAQGGFGSPNPYNFFNKELSPYYMAGVRASWSIWDWGNVKRSKDNLYLRQTMLSEQEHQHRQAIDANIIKIDADIARLGRAIERDNTLVKNRAALRKTATQQLEQGDITSTDLLREILAEQRALTQLSINQVELMLQHILVQFENGTIH
ncbi:MAG: TolC family protein [Flavobacteriales bacterium]|nr:TolC family protein [Flavobacteriales bacterium]